jgi:hypothetical protein
MQLDKASARSLMAQEEAERASIASKRSEDDLVSDPSPREDPKLRSALLRSEAAQRDEEVARGKVEAATKELEELTRERELLIGKGEEGSLDSNSNGSGVEALLFHTYRLFRTLLLDIDEKISSAGADMGEEEGNRGMWQECFELAIGRLRSFCIQYRVESTREGPGVIKAALGSEGSRVRDRMVSELSVILGSEL